VRALTTGSREASFATDAASGWSLGGVVFGLADAPMFEGYFFMSAYFLN
jgi:hypothetical protein